MNDYAGQDGTPAVSAAFLRELAENLPPPGAASFEIEVRKFIDRVRATAGGKLAASQDVAEEDRQGCENRIEWFGETFDRMSDWLATLPPGAGYFGLSLAAELVSASLLLGSAHAVSDESLAFSISRNAKAMNIAGGIKSGKKRRTNAGVWRTFLSPYIAEMLRLHPTWTAQHIATRVLADTEINGDAKRREIKLPGSKSVANLVKEMRSRPGG